MKLLVALLLSFFLIGCATTTRNFEPSFADIPAELYEWGDEYVWSVKHFGEGIDRKPKGHQGHGSGIWLDSDTMVTACHVPSMEEEVWASQDGAHRNGVNVELVVEFCHRMFDQAVMTVTSGSHSLSEPVTFGTLPERGERIYIIGFPGDNPLTVTTGWFVGKGNQTRDIDNGSWGLAADAMGGNSGGAVVVIRDNEIQLVGILVAGFPSGHITTMKELAYTQEWLLTHQ